MRQAYARWRALTPQPRVGSGRSLPRSAGRTALACMARDALQVILSGGEILLDRRRDGLPFEPEQILSKILENARYINNLIGALEGAAGAKDFAGN